MESPYDWICLAIFAGLVVLFLHRSTDGSSDQNDSLLFYLAAGAGCGVANYLGNRGDDLIAIPIIVTTLAFIDYFLKPFKFGSRK
jgi:hypothetical protein